jgi:predicted permease
MLLVGAGLLLRTLQNLGNVNLGFRPSGLVVFGISPPANIASDAQVAQFYSGLLDRLRSLPEVESATVMENRIGSGWSDNTAVRVDGADPNPGKFSSIRTNPVGPDYFHLLGTPLNMGRDIAATDTATSQKVIVVNQTFVDRYLSGRNPLGHGVSLEARNDQYLGPYQIIGVVPDITYTSVGEKPRPMGWFPFVQINGESNMQVEIRTSSNSGALLADVRRIVREFGPDIPLLEPMSQTAQLQESYSDQRLFSRLATFFGLLAALLVAIGLYGTLAYRVNRRTAEIGVRMALGAQRTEVLWMILRESLVIAGLGIAVGLPLAFAAARLLKSMLFRLSPADPITFALALMGVLGVALFSALLPARRASCVEPVVALRYE